MASPASVDSLNQFDVLIGQQPEAARPLTAIAKPGIGNGITSNPREVDDIVINAWSKIYEGNISDLEQISIVSKR